jgi:hypothetical protein
VFPIIAGDGKKLFDTSLPQVAWKLVEARQTAEVAVQTLRRDR